MDTSEFPKLVRRVLGAKVSGLGAGLLAQLVLARILGLEAFGKYVYLVALINMAAVLAKFGFDVLLTKSVPQYLVTKQFGLLRGLILSATFLPAFVAFLITGGALLAVGFLAPDVLDAHLAEALMALACSPVLVLTQISAGLLQALGKSGLSELVQAVVQPLLISSGTFILVLAVGSASVVMPLLAFFLALLLVLVVFRIKAAVLIGSYLKRSRVQFRVRAWLDRAWHFFISSISGFALAQLDVVLVGTFVGTESAGMYRVASRLAKLVSIPLYAVNLPLSPVVARLHVLGEKNEFQRVVTQAARIAALLALPVACGLFLLGRNALSLFGPGFDDALTPMLILLLGNTANVLFGPVGLVLNMAGFEGVVARVLGGSAMISVALNITAVITYGTVGVAIATALLTAVWNLMLFSYARSRLGIRTTAI